MKIPNDKKMENFTKYQYEMIIHAVEHRQSSYVVGDRMYNDYEEILNELRSKIMTALDWE